MAGRRDRSDKLFALVFLVVIGSFLGSSLFARYASSEISSLSDRLATNVAPSIENLASIRGSALQAQLALSVMLTREPDAPQADRALATSLVALREGVARYLVLPRSPGERPVHDELQQAWARFDEGARIVEELARAGEIDRARARMTAVDAAARQLVGASIRAIEFNADHGQQLAAEIGQVRRRTGIIASSLTVLSVLLGLTGGAMLYRQARLKDSLTDERTRALEDRAAELEQFAGRVAHDIRGPLGAATLAAELLERTGLPDEVAEIATRLKRNLARATAITTDLLQFARAGARPDPGARTSPRDVIADVIPDLELEAAERHIALDWQPVPPVMVACSSGVYLSLLTNLVRNAIKYMGAATTRRITVRVIDEDGAVRTDVVDTGPGIREDQLPMLFEPYFRGATAADREGLGLGLPTVRKLAEGHGGEAGVRSREGGGSTFWFTLPRAGSVET